MNGSYPERVVFYRDGIGHTQIRSICQIEIESINQAFAEVEVEKMSDSEDKIGLMYIVVNKKTNTEVYAQGIYEDTYKNPVPGTVLDVPQDKENAPIIFYMVPQWQRLGMSMPTKYSIVYDTIGETLENIQLLSYKLCHLYFNVGGPIRIPAPI